MDLQWVLSLLLIYQNNQKYQKYFFYYVWIPLTPSLPTTSILILANLAQTANYKYTRLGYGWFFRSNLFYWLLPFRIFFLIIFYEIINFKTIAYWLPTSHALDVKFTLTSRTDYINIALAKFECHAKNSWHFLVYGWIEWIRSACLTFDNILIYHSSKKKHEIVWKITWILHLIKSRGTTAVWVIPQDKIPPNPHKA